MNKKFDLPTPQPDMALYRSIMQSGFDAYPERLENYHRYQQSRRGAEIDYLPIRLDIENVSRCNFRCTMCEVSNWEHSKRAKDMSLSDFKNLIDEQYGLIEIKLQGLGEPLMAAPSFFKMIEYARSRHIWVRTTVNGSLLHVRDNYKHLIDSGVCEVMLSIDGASQETYEKIRRGGKFSKVTFNCQTLNAYAATVNNVRTRMWVTLQQDNLHELDQFIPLAAKLGFERVTLSLNLNDWGQDRWRSVNDRIDIKHTFTPAIAQALVDQGQSLGVDVTFWLIDEKFDLEDTTKLCPWPFERAYISSDMRTVPCCMVSNPDVFELGDARHLTEVWHGKTLQEFRRAHVTGNLPDICKTCYKQTQTHSDKVIPIHAVKSVA